MGRQYTKEFKAEATKLSDEIGLADTANQLGIPYQTLAEWSKKRMRGSIGPAQGDQPGEAHIKTAYESALEQELAEAKRVNAVLEEALTFFVNSRKKHP